MRSWPRFLCFALALAVLCVAPDVARATPVLFGITFSEQLIRIDPTTGTGSLVGSLDTPMSGFGIDSRGGRLYTFDQRADRVRELDPLTGKTKDTIDIGAAGFFGEGGLAFGPDGTGYLAQAQETPMLSSFDLDHPGNGVTTIGLGVSMDGLSFRPGTGVLYGISQLSLDLYTINLSTGDLTLVGDTGISGVVGLGGLAFAPDGSLFLATGGSFYELDPDNGSARLVGSTTGFGDVSGLAFVDVPEEPIPEPASVLLLGGGLLGLVWRARRRRTR